MDESPNADLSFNRTPSAFEGKAGYDLWFDVPPRSDDATTPELQTLCQGAILVGHIADAMGWDWPTLLGNIDHLSAPVDGFLLLEVRPRLFHSARFRRALDNAVEASGLNPFKVKVTDAENANVYILGHGLPAL
ncbi:hypothetical protein EON81_29760 [bacterium]|nr:MAG: hypothetical protein EON81_29760 [bacterium]